MIPISLASQTAVTGSRGLSSPSAFRRTFVVAFVCSVSVTGVVVGAFGSFRNGLAYLRGECVIWTNRINLPPESRFNPGYQTRVEVANLQAEPLQLLGASQSCQCAVASGLPVTVPPRAARAITVVVQRAKSGSAFEQSVTLFTDCPANPALPIRLVDVGATTAIPAD